MAQQWFSLDRDSERRGWLGDGASPGGEGGAGGQ